MQQQEEKKRTMGGLYRKTSKSGLEFLTGFVEVNGVKVEIVAFENTKKFSETSPDYAIYQSRPYEGGGAAPRAGAPVSNSRPRPQPQTRPSNPDLLDDEFGNDIPY